MDTETIIKWGLVIVIVLLWAILQRLYEIFRKVVSNAEHLVDQLNDIKDDIKQEIIDLNTALLNSKTDDDEDET